MALYFSLYRYRIHQHTFRMPQDSGYAWVVCGASFWFQVINAGLTTCAGLLYIMFKENVEGNDTTISLVTSLNVGLYLAFCKLI